MYAIYANDVTMEYENWLFGKVKDYNDIFGEPKEVKREIKNDIREEELNQDAHLFAQIYFTDFNDYIYVDQKEEKNAFDTVLWLIILLWPST